MPVTSETKGDQKALLHIKGGKRVTLSQGVNRFAGSTA
jgi:hypothetical protein